MTWKKTPLYILATPMLLIVWFLDKLMDAGNELWDALDGSR